MIAARGRLPNPMERSCTTQLKVESVKRWMKQHNNVSQYNDVIGIRYDEKRRWERIMFEHCNKLMPLVTAGVTKDVVRDFWAQMPFDLEIDNTEVSGNCDLCFLKGRRSIRNLIRLNPKQADWWIAQEDSQSATFLKGISYREIRDSQHDLFDDAEKRTDCMCTD